ncbi:MAG TPA: hypothetical protein PK711_10180 [Bacteroidales bacterium]|nr:hypothetical protein [Bacteroidales bacterium]
MVSIIATCGPTRDSGCEVKLCPCAQVAASAYALPCDHAPEALLAFTVIK